MARVSTRLRIEGTETQIHEALRRLRYVFEVHEASKLYGSRSDPEVKFCYLRCYTYAIDSLLDQMEAAHRYIAELEAQNGELGLEIERLKDALGILPKPGPGDAVLSPRHKPQGYPPDELT